MPKNSRDKEDSPTGTMPEPDNVAELPVDALQALPFAAVGSGAAPPSNSSAENEGQPMMHPALVIVRIPGEKTGSEHIEIMPINGLDPLSIPTLLKLALKIKNADLGIQSDIH